MMSRKAGRSRRGIDSRGEKGGQGTALDQFHREIRAGILEDAELIDRDDARMLELAADLRLLDEPVDELGTVAVPLEQDLDGQVAPEVGVASLEDRAHSAAGDLAQQLIAIASRGRIGHLRGARLDDGRRGPASIGVAERGPGDPPELPGQHGQYTRIARRMVGRPVAIECPRAVAHQPLLEQTRGQRPLAHWASARIPHTGHSFDSLIRLTLSTRGALYYSRERSARFYYKAWRGFLHDAGRFVRFVLRNTQPTQPGGRPGGFLLRSLLSPIPLRSMIPAMPGPGHNRGRS